MEFEDYEDMFTFEEWSVQHLASDDDAKTFDELCEEVLRLSDACNKVVCIDYYPRTNVNSMSQEATSKALELVSTSESEITSSASPRRHLELGEDHQLRMHEDFTASELQEANDLISSAEKHVDTSQFSPGTNNFSAELMSKEDRDALSKKCEYVTRLKVAVDTTRSKAEEYTSEIILGLTGDVSSEEGNSLGNELLVKLKQFQSISENAVNFPSEKTKDLISNDTNGDNSHTQHSKSNEHMSFNYEIQSEICQITEDSEKFATAIQNIDTQHEGKSEKILDNFDVVVDENQKKSQNDHLDFSNLNENEIESEPRDQSSKGKPIALTVNKDGICDIMSTSNTTLQLDSEMPKCSISVLNDISSPPEFAKADSPTEVARNCQDDDKTTQKQLSVSGMTISSRSPSLSSKTVLKTSLSLNQRKSENSANDLLKTNLKSSKEIVCLESLEFVLSPEDSKLNNIETKIKTETNDTNVTNLENNVNFKKEKTETFDITWKINTGETKTKIASSLINYPENILEGNVQPELYSNNTLKCENNVIQKDRSVKKKLLLQRTRNEKNDSRDWRMQKISIESFENRLRSKMRSMRSRKPISQDEITSSSNKKHSITLRELSAGDTNVADISSVNEQNVSEGKPTTDNSENNIINSKESASMAKRPELDVLATPLESHTIEMQSFENKCEYDIDIGISTENSRKLQDDSKKSKFPLSTLNEPVNSNEKIEFVLSKTDNKNNGTLPINPLHKKHKNENKIYFRTTDTISVLDDQLTSRTHSTCEIDNCHKQETSTATIEIKPNEQFPRDSLTTVINVKHTSMSPTENTATCITHKSDPSGNDKKIFISSRRQRAARIIPFSRNTRTAFTLGLYHSKCDKKISVEGEHETKIRVTEKESSVSSSQKNISNDSDEIIVVETDELSDPALKPRNYEGKIIASDNTSHNIDKKASRIGKRGADALDGDSLTPEENKTSRTCSPGNINKKRTIASEEETLTLLPKTLTLESTEEGNTVDHKSLLNLCSISAKNDTNIDPLKADFLKVIPNSSDLQIVPMEESEKKLSNPSFLITHEDENPEKRTTRILHRSENKCNLTPSKSHTNSNVKDTTTSNKSKSFCGSSSHNISNDETMKAVCASENVKISTPPDKNRVSGKRTITESTKNLRSPSKVTRLGITRSIGSGSEMPLFLKKSNLYNRRCQSRTIKNGFPKIIQNSAQRECEKKSYNQPAITSTDVNSDNQIKQIPLIKTTEEEKLTRVIHQVPSETKEPSIALGNTTHSQMPTLPRTVRHLRRSSIPVLRFPANRSSSQESASTSGRILRRRVCPSTQPTDPTPRTT